MTTLTFTAFAAWVADQLLAAGFDPAPGVDVGPAGDERQADQPGPQILLTRGPGPGLTLEGTFDRVIWQADVAGDQLDYQSAEDLALALDRILLLLDHSQNIGMDNARILCFNRAGSGPVVARIDDGDRWHLTCSYLVTVESGI